MCCCSERLQRVTGQMFLCEIKPTQMFHWSAGWISDPFWWRGLYLFTQRGSKWGVLFFGLQDSPDVKLKPYMQLWLSQVWSRARRCGGQIPSSTWCGHWAEITAHRVHGGVYVNNWIPQVLFLVFFHNQCRAHYFSCYNPNLSFYLKNESPYNYLVWRISCLAYELHSSRCLASMLGRDGKQTAEDVCGGGCIFNSVSHSHDHCSHVKCISCSNDVA